MKRLTIEITDLEYQAMADVVCDPREWARDAIKGKAFKCINVVKAKEQNRLLADPFAETIPATVDGILESHFAQPEYKTRAERDAEAEAAQTAAMHVDEPPGE
jgi:hypothetical protein